ncbi:DUF6351 family protein [Streptomyces sp. 4N509B]|uniref:DUF6351 family protein n=1 Tax=Streptomyces sp. 4N509B TaxID=3457413 RepID=UPI003FD64C61
MRGTVWWTTLALVAAAAPLVAAAPPSAAADRPELSLTVLSSRPDTVSGGDALVELTVTHGVRLDRVRVEADRRDVTGAFRPAGRDRLVGLVTGLPEGRVELAATAHGGGHPRAELTVVNHPRTGPVLSGPHETPFVCETDRFQLVGGGTLGPPQDEHCTVPTRVDYAYRSTAGGALLPLPEGTARPADLAWTTTSAGARVPYIVRVETGVINRGVYEIALLDDPLDGVAPDAHHASPGWNGRLVYTFGGGCVRGWYHQGDRTGGVTEDGMLREGFAVASSSLNVFGVNCNDLLAAETMAMVKERFVEAYGVPEFTVGWGCSGGAYQAQQIGDNYPGLLDGIVVGCGFPDVGFATIHTLTDASLLHHYFEELAPGAFTAEQQRAVSGFGRWEAIERLAAAAGRIDPRRFCPDALPPELRYDPVTRPDGARCDVYSHHVNVYGTDPDTGFARRPLDNTGIEYGRQALADGTITVEQFLDLNERVGGFDVDGGHVPERTEADPLAVRAAYGTGRLLNGGGGLASIPIIDFRSYTDLLPEGDLHMRVHSFATRARLERANGTAANQVMLVESGGPGSFTSDNPRAATALYQMAAWVEAIQADRRPGGALARVVRNQPADLVEGCWTAGGEWVAERQRPGVGTTRCNTEYPVFETPRMVAGAGIANDVVVCRRVPVDPASYGVPLTAEQGERLRRIFPDGVCDWSRDGVGQRGLDGTWLFF